MAKDPAFLFFPGDWLGGTMTLNRHQKGAYLDLLMVQFNNGHMSLDDIKETLGDKDFGDFWESKLKKKFKIDSDGLYFNKKLEDEVLKRRKFIEHQRENAKKRWDD